MSDEEVRLRLDHIGIAVPDLEEARERYRAGLEEVVEALPLDLDRAVRQRHVVEEPIVSH